MLRGPDGERNNDSLRDPDTSDRRLRGGPTYRDDEDDEDDGDDGDNEVDGEGD